MKPIASFSATFLWAILLIAVVGITVSLTQMAWISALAWAIVAAGTAAGLIRLQHRHAGNTRARKAARTRRQHRATRKEQSDLKDPATHPPVAVDQRSKSSHSFGQRNPLPVWWDEPHCAEGRYAPVWFVVFTSAGSFFIAVVAVRGESVDLNSPLPIHVLNAPKRAIHLPQFDTPKGFLQGRVLRCALRRTVVEK
ncbi:hypothetical protein [Rhodococcus sp. AQ5-07]|uniref:hypothetical protein n=1 Tax=Rhodococcus sp. AQ5-07 TaxID=2054902 RepID=UPI0018A785C4|nr:hypothetical protein [Rhodococcus sp. AQ5-07]